MVRSQLDLPFHMLPSQVRSGTHTINGKAFTNHQFHTNKSGNIPSTRVTFSEPLNMLRSGPINSNLSFFNCEKD